MKDIDFLDGMLSKLDEDVKVLEKEETLRDDGEKVPNKILRNFDKWEKYMKQYDMELKEDAIGDSLGENNKIQNSKNY